MDTIKVLSYNIMSGGFGFNDYSDNQPHPQRIDQIIQLIKDSDADFVGLVDTFRWKQLYSRNDLKKMFGYKYAFLINIEDARVDERIGIAILSNYPIKNTQKLRIHNRNCIKTEILFNGKYIDAFILYLDDLSEDTRLRQIKPLVKNIDAEKPTLIIGDFNSLTRQEAIKVKKVMLPMISLLKSKLDKTLIDSFNSACDPKVMPMIKGFGLKDAGEKEKKPTALTKINPMKLPLIFRVDYIFYSKHFEARSFRTLDDSKYHGSSDHLAIISELKLV